MSLYRDLAEQLSYDPAERSGVLGARRADGPWILRTSVGGGVLLAILVLTGGGILPPGDWGAALFCGMIGSTALRGGFLAWAHLRDGGWQAWRARPVNNEVCDRLSGGIGPAFSPITAVIAGLFAGIAARAILSFARWP